MDETTVFLKLALGEGVSEDVCAAFAILGLDDRRKLLKWPGGAALLDEDHIPVATFARLMTELKGANSTVTDQPSERVAISLFVDLVRGQMPALRKRAADESIGAVADTAAAETSEDDKDTRASSKAWAGLLETQGETVELDDRLHSKHLGTMVREVLASGYFTTMPNGDKWVNVYAKKQKTEVAPGLSFETEPDGGSTGTAKVAAVHIQFMYVALMGAAAAMSLYEIAPTARGGGTAGNVNGTSKFDPAKPKRLAFTVKDAKKIWRK